MLKCGSENSFLSATRRSASPTFGCMKPENSDSWVSLSTGGSVRRLVFSFPFFDAGFSSLLALQARPAAEKIFLFLRHQRRSFGCMNERGLMRFFGSGR